MRNLRTFVRRRRKATLVAVVALIVVPAAVAAGFIIYSGVSGSATGNLGSDVTNASAIQITGTITGNPEPGQVGAVSYTWHNASGVTETLHYPFTYVVTTTDDAAPDSCASHLTENHSNLTPSTPATMTAGQTLTFTGGTLTADATTPPACAGKAATITVTGTTTP